jgi:hypothetical protein
VSNVFTVTLLGGEGTRVVQLTRRVIALGIEAAPVKGYASLALEGSFPDARFSPPIIGDALEQPFRDTDITLREPDRDDALYEVRRQGFTIVRLDVAPLGVVTIGDREWLATADGNLQDLPATVE